MDLKNPGFLASKMPECLRSASDSSVVLADRTVVVIDRPLLLRLSLPEFAAELSS